MRSGAWLIVVLTLVSLDAAAKGCPWDSGSFSFAGTAAEQAKCLLRNVRPGGVIEDTDANVPIKLATMLGQPVTIPVGAFRTYLQSKQLDEKDVGGSLDAPLSTTPAPRKAIARYFVIHDTSTIHCKRAFPDVTDQPDQSWNTPSPWANSKAAHLFITRSGISVQPQGRTFATPWRATRFESRLGTSSRGLFLHIENVQLRRPQVASGESLKTTDGQCVNDRVAQTPGFTIAQYRRLAEAYVAASIRSGTWMIPVFHAVLDADIPGGHDDPQNFNLNQLANEVCAVRSATGKPC